MKSIRIQSFSGLYSSAFGLNNDQKNFEYEEFSRNGNDAVLYSDIYYGIVHHRCLASPALKVFVFGVILVHIFRIFRHLDRIWGGTEYLSVFSPNAGKCGKMWTRITTNSDTFYAVKAVNKLLNLPEKARLVKKGNEISQPTSLFLDTTPEQFHRV